MGSQQSKKPEIEKKPSTDDIENGGIVTEREVSEIEKTCSLKEIKVVVPKVISDKKVPKDYVALQIDTATEILTAKEARVTTGSDDDGGIETLGRSVEGLETLLDVESFESDDSTQMVSDVMPEFEVSSESKSASESIPFYSSSEESKITTVLTTSAKSSDSVVSSESESQKLLDQAEMDRMKEEIREFNATRKPNQIMDDPFSRSVLAHLNLGKMDKKTRRDTILKLPKPGDLFLMHLKEQGEDTTLFSEEPWNGTEDWTDEEEEEDPELDPKSYGDVKGNNPWWPAGSNRDADNVPYGEMPPLPTIQDYFRHAHTGQIRISEYEILSREEMGDGTVKLEFMGPEENRVEDFWTELISHRVKLIAMFGKVVEKGALPNCGRYFPKDFKREHRCGDVMVTRMTRPVTRYGHCRIQQFAVRHLAIPESEGSYTVWHCEREYRWDKTKDYDKEDEEFDKLKMEYLGGEKSKVYAVHGPMEYSPLLIQEEEEEEIQKAKRTVKEFYEKKKIHV